MLDNSLKPPPTYSTNALGCGCLVGVFYIIALACSLAAIFGMGTWGFASGIILLLILLWFPLRSRLGWWKRFHNDPQTRLRTQICTLLVLIGIIPIIYGISEWHKTGFETCIQEVIALGKALYRDWDRLYPTEEKKHEFATLACHLEREFDSEIPSDNIFLIIVPSLFIIGMLVWHLRTWKRQQGRITADQLCEMYGCLRKATNVIPTHKGDTFWCGQHFSELQSTIVQCDNPRCQREATRIIPTDTTDTFWCEEHFIEITSATQQCNHRNCSQEAEITLTVRGVSVHLCQAHFDEQTNRDRG